MTYADPTTAPAGTRVQDSAGTLATVTGFTLDGSSVGVRFDDGGTHVAPVSHRRWTVVVPSAVDRRAARRDVWSSDPDRTTRREHGSAAVGVLCAVAGVVVAGLAGFGIGAVSGPDTVTVPAPVPAAPMVKVVDHYLDTLPPCEYEDSANCIWDASEQGNGEGISFVDIDGTAYYADGEYGTWNGFVRGEVIVCDDGSEVARDVTLDGIPWAACQ